jgi:hypothetical protein
MKMNEVQSPRVIQCIIHVHQTLGPGFLESVYRRAVLIEPCRLPPGRGLMKLSPGFPTSPRSPFTVLVNTTTKALETAFRCNVDDGNRRRFKEYQVSTLECYTGTAPGLTLSAPAG